MPLPARDYVPDFGVGRGRSTRQFGVFEDGVQIRGNLFEGEVVVAMAMGATDGIEMLAFCLLRA